MKIERIPCEVPRYAMCIFLDSEADGGPVTIAGAVARLPQYTDDREHPVYIVDRLTGTGTPACLAVVIP